MEEIEGIVERITFSSGETGFCVIKIKTRDPSGLVTAVGSVASVNIGATVILKGEWKRDLKFGRQFSISDYQEIMPATAAGIERYLGSGLIKGIGPVNARRIVKTFGLDTMRIIDEDSGRLCEVKGLGSKRVELIKETWKEQKEVKNIMIFLQGQGVSAVYATKIFKKYGNDSIRKVKENPYRLAEDIWGIGFRTADKIAAMMGVDRKSYDRCKAGILYALEGFSDDGHCFALREEITAESVRMLEVETELAEESISRLISEKLLFAEPDGEIYLPQYYYSEIGTAKRIREILASPVRFHASDADDKITGIEALNNIKYDAIQIEAIKKAVTSKFSILTGGPGTGKTTTTLAIISIFKKLGAKIMLAAPTGRAAKRLSETAGMEAKTIHRLLEYSQSEGYARNSGNKLECDVLIIDETSMVDILLMYNLVRAVDDKCAVILAGDADQLPSVGPGNVLRDIIDSGVVPVTRLTRIFRQAMGSDIIMNAHRVNSGEMPVLKNGRDSDFFFIEEEDPGKIADTIRELCVSRLPKFYDIDAVGDIQILCPMIRGETGTNNLNAVIRDALNPTGVSIKQSGTEFRMRDKVMQIRNNYDKNVFNGDIGVIVGIDAEDRIAAIDFGGSIVKYEAQELDEVVLAYAATVHKSQGSEYKVVIMPFSTQHFMMLQRNLLYTGITRAKKVFVLVGTKKAVAMAVANDKIQRRNTRLSERLKQ